jgi:signal transduction histidine kinase
VFITLGLVVVAALIIAGILAWGVARGVAAPLVRIADVAQRTAKGDFSQRIAVGTQDEVGQIAQSFNQMAESLSHQIKLASQEKDRLELLNEYRLNLFRAITQAFQGPLMQLQTLAQSLYMEMYGSLNEVQRETVAVMRRTINRQGALLSGLIDFSQAERRQLKLTRQRVNLADGVTELVATLNVLYSAKNVQLVVDVSNTLRALFVDKTRLDQVLEQLLTLTYYLCVPNGEVRFYAKQEGSHAAIVLTDTSSGLSDASKDQLFEIFFVPLELDSAQNQPEFLPGLGLAFVKSILEQMEGTIEVEVTAGKGNAFRITLPTID